MQLILEQTFPLGRFHATPWKVFPYDDPHGEWPPSPWRLVRAVLARSYQLDREIADSTEAHAELREALVRAFATSQVEWQLPPSSWRGPALRQYQPAVFQWNPPDWKNKGVPAFKAYNTTKVLDNFWVTANGAAAPILWRFDSPDWTPPLLAHLDACLARMTYFGRAESITEIRRTEAAWSPDEPVRLSPRRSGKAVPVLALQPDATLAQLEATTDAPSVKDTNIPPGSRWMYAERPPRPQIRSVKRHTPQLPPTQLIQFAIGSNIPVRYKDVVLITERFRSRVLGSFTKRLTGDPKSNWKDSANDISAQAHLLSGRNSDGSPSKDHRHVSFFLCGTVDAPSRLCVWRNESFDDLEQRSILDAANTPLPLSYKDDPWTLNLVPLDKLVPSPPGLDSSPVSIWKSLTPYVPPRHVFGRSGKEKPGCSVIEQILAELSTRGFNPNGVSVAAEKHGWVKIHRLKIERDARTNNDKLGYSVNLTFSNPIKGPISLGSSSHFGLGLFVPADM